jgi:hypothetical protein
MWAGSEVKEATCVRPAGLRAGLNSACAWSSKSATESLRVVEPVTAPGASAPGEAGGIAALAGGMHAHPCKGAGHRPLVVSLSPTVPHPLRIGASFPTHVGTVGGSKPTRF